jgi:hypothetical protein
MYWCTCSTHDLEHRSLYIVLCLVSVGIDRDESFYTNLHATLRLQPQVVHCTERSCKSWIKVCRLQLGKMLVA